jgi:predicted acylesterase/phospholipase RssA
LSERPSPPYRRILSLDGGGTWALVQARTLVDLLPMAKTGHDVLRRFDLVVANSGGSLVAGGLAANLPLANIVALFESKSAREEVFRARCLQSLRHALPVPRYSTAGAGEGVGKQLGQSGNVKLVDWEALRQRQQPPLAHLLFVGFDYDMTRAAFFRTDTSSRAASLASTIPSGATLLDAIHASINAPVIFFDAPTQVAGDAGQRERRYWDGGVAGYNNPCLAGVVEALANGATRQDIRVLSIGTGTVRRPLRPPNASLDDTRFIGGEPPGFVGDVRKFAGAIVDDPPDAASFISHVTLGGDLPPPKGVRVGEGPLVRMNPLVRPIQNGNGEWDWNVPEKWFTTEQWNRLLVLEMDAVADDDVALIRGMCEAWHAGEVPNQPIRAGAGMRAEVGHDVYAEAKAAFGRW